MSLIPNFKLTPTPTLSQETTTTYSRERVVAAAVVAEEEVVVAVAVVADQAQGLAQGLAQVLAPEDRKFCLLHQACNTFCTSKLILHQPRKHGLRFQLWRLISRRHWPSTGIRRRWLLRRRCCPSLQIRSWYRGRCWCSRLRGWCVGVLAWDLVSWRQPVPAPQ